MTNLSFNIEHLTMFFFAPHCQRWTRSEGPARDAVRDRNAHGARQAQWAGITWRV